MRNIRRLPPGLGKLCACPERITLVPGPIGEAGTSSACPRKAFLACQEALQGVSINPLRCLYMAVVLEKPNFTLACFSGSPLVIPKLIWVDASWGGGSAHHNTPVTAAADCLSMRNFSTFFGNRWKYAGSLMMN